jgi:hypothetical protein
LSVSEDGLKVLGIVKGECSIPPFRVDVRAACECVGFTPESSRAVFNSIIEAGEVFRPAGLAASKDFGGGEVLKGLVVGNDSNSVSGTLKVGSPFLKSGEDSK